MATNSYFRSNFRGVPEQNLVEDLIIEAIQIYGFDVKYLPRSQFNYDEFYGDDLDSRFQEAYTVEMYLKTIDNFGGDGHFLSKFGLEIRDEVVLSCSIKRFAQEISNIATEIVRPNEGDLIRLPKEVDSRERLFEITFTNEIEENHQLGILYTYEIKCRAFEYSGEKFETGIEEIDQFQVDYAQTQTIVVSPGVGLYQTGEVVSQGELFSAEVVLFSEPDLVVTKIKGEYENGIAIVGQNSLTSRLPEDMPETTGNDTGLPNNDLVDNFADDFIVQQRNPLIDGDC